MAGDSDEACCAEAGDVLAVLPGVQAVSLGSSRAAGTAGPDSDRDFAVYYRLADRGRPPRRCALPRPG